MSFLLSMLLPFLGCIALIATTSVLWWNSLQNPWQFSIIGLLALLGLHRLVQVLLEIAKLFPIGRGYFLVARENPDFTTLAQENINFESALITVVVIAAGIPVLFWLRNALPKV